MMMIMMVMSCHCRKTCHYITVTHSLIEVNSLHVPDHLVAARLQETISCGGAIQGTFISFPQLTCSLGKDGYIALQQEPQKKSWDKVFFEVQKSIRWEAVQRKREGDMCEDHEMRLLTLVKFWSTLTRAQIPAPGLLLLASICP